MLEDEGLIVGVIKKESHKKQTLVSFLAGEEKVTAKEMEGVKPKYVFSSVFPNEEVRDEVYEILKQLEKEKYYEILGIPLDSQEDVSLDRLRELVEEQEKQKKPKKGKFLSKIIRRGE